MKPFIKYASFGNLAAIIPLIIVAYPHPLHADIYPPAVNVNGMEWIGYKPRRERAVSMAIDYLDS